MWTWINHIGQVDVPITPNQILAAAIGVGVMGFGAMFASLRFGKFLEWGASGVAAAIVLAVNVQWYKSDLAAFRSWGWLLMAVLSAFVGFGVQRAVRRGD